MTQKRTKSAGIEKHSRCKGECRCKGDQRRSPDFRMFLDLVKAGMHDAMRNLDILASAGRGLQAAAESLTKLSERFRSDVDSAQTLMALSAPPEPAARTRGEVEGATDVLREIFQASSYDFTGSKDVSVYCRRAEEKDLDGGAAFEILLSDARKDEYGGVSSSVKVSERFAFRVYPYSKAKTLAEFDKAVAALKFFSFPKKTEKKSARHASPASPAKPAEDDSSRKPGIPTQAGVDVLGRRAVRDAIVNGSQYILPKRRVRVFFAGSSHGRRSYRAVFMGGRGWDQPLFELKVSVGPEGPSAGIGLKFDQCLRSENVKGLRPRKK